MEPINAPLDFSHGQPDPAAERNWRDSQKRCDHRCAHGRIAVGTAASCRADDRNFRDQASERTGEEACSEHSPKDGSHTSCRSIARAESEGSEESRKQAGTENDCRPTSIGSAISTRIADANGIPRRCESGRAFERGHASGARKILGANGTEKSYRQTPIHSAEFGSPDRPAVAGSAAMVATDCGGGTAPPKESGQRATG